MPTEPLDNVIDSFLSQNSTGITLDGLNNFDMLRLAQQWQCVRNRPPRLARILPGYQNIFQIEVLDFGRNKKDRAASVHQEITGIEPSERIEKHGFATGARNDKIGSACFARDIVRGSRHCRAPLDVLRSLLQSGAKVLFRLRHFLCDLRALALHESLREGAPSSRPETLRTAIATELLVQADGLVGGSDAVLVIDDTEIPKKGAHSVGVAAQYASAARGLPKAGSRSSMGAAWPRSAIAHKFAGHSAPTDDGRVKASMRGIWGRAPEKPCHGRGIVLMALAAGGRH
jgi:DDE superfamily endonuclease